MKRLPIPAESAVRPPAQSVFLPGTSDDAVVLIHGFTGITNDMLPVAEKLNAAGFAVSVPRLPGHGTNGDDLLATNHRQWLRRGLDAYLELAGKYKRVFVGGLSMGGLIATAMAAHFPVSGLILYAPAFVLYDWRVPFAPYLGPFLPRLPRRHDLEHEDPDLRAIEEAYMKYEWIRPAGHLWRLQRYARQRLREVSCPSLLVVSPEDRTVRLSVREYILGRIGGPLDVVELSTSGHVVTNDDERDRVAEESLRWLRAR